MNILHFGCSFTCYSGKEFYELQPPLMNKLADKLINLHNDIKYYNFAVGAGGGSMQYHLLKKAVEQHNKIDLILFQVSIPFRGFWQHSDIDLSPLSAQQNGNVLDYTHRIRTTFNWYNGGNVYPSDKWQKAGKKFTNYVEENFYFNQSFIADWVGNILTVKSFCKNKDLKLLIYSHRLNVFDTANSIEEKIAIDNLDFDVKTELGKENWNNFVIDKGTHLSPAGNDYVIDNILLPRIKQNLDL